MWQANAPIESRFQPQGEELDPVAQQKKQLYEQAMGDLGQQQPKSKEGQRGNRTYSGSKKDSNPMSSILSMFGGGSNGNSTTQAGPDFGSFGNIA